MKSPIFYGAYRQFKKYIPERKIYGQVDGDKCQGEKQPESNRESKVECSLE